MGSTIFVTRHDLCEEAAEHLIVLEGRFVNIWSQLREAEDDVRMLEDLIHGLYDILESGYLVEDVVEFMLTRGNSEIAETGKKIIALNAQGLWIHQYRDGIDACQHDFTGLADAMLILQANGQLDDQAFWGLVAHPYPGYLADLYGCLAVTKSLQKENVEYFLSPKYHRLFQGDHAESWQSPLHDIALTDAVLKQMKIIVELPLDEETIVNGLEAFFNYCKSPYFEKDEPVSFMALHYSRVLSHRDVSEVSLDDLGVMGEKIKDSFPLVVLKGDKLVNEFQQIKRIVLGLGRIVDAPGNRFRPEDIAILKAEVVFNFQNPITIICGLSALNVWDDLKFPFRAVMKKISSIFRQCDQEVYQNRISGLVRSYVNLHFTLLLSGDSVSDLLRLTNHYALLQSQGLGGLWGMFEEGIANVIKREFIPLVGYEFSLARVKVANDALKVMLDAVPKEQRVVSGSSAYRQYCLGMMTPRLLISVPGRNKRARVSSDAVSVIKKIKSLNG